MPQWLISLIGIAFGALLTLFIQYQTSRNSRWKLLEDRKTEYAKRREPLYGKALEFIYSIEMSYGTPEIGFKVRDGLSVWLMSEAFLLPPGGKDVLLRLRYQLGEYLCYSGPGVLTNEEKQLFRNTLREAKDFFLESRDIAWIPKELSTERSIRDEMQKKKP
jgi:hypothetical protein